MPGRCEPWPGKRKASGARAGRPAQRLGGGRAGRPGRQPGEQLVAVRRRGPRRGARSAARVVASERRGRRARARGRLQMRAREPARPGRAAPPRSCAESSSGKPAATGERAPARRARRRRRLLEDDVRVGAADAERRDAGAARPRRAATRAGLGEQLDRARRPSRPAADGSSTCRVRGSTPCRIAITILITPATPAAAWVWPMFDLTEPSHSGCSRLLAVGGEQRLRLDRVAERGAGAVRLDRVDVGRARGRRWPAPGGSPAPATGRSARSGRWTRRPG